MSKPDRALGKRDGELYLCRHCTNLLRSALTARGWRIRLIH